MDTPPPPSPALAAKLNPLGASALQVLRTVACERIVQATAAKLVLVRAPAGFGKTTAMLQARAGLEEQGIATAWLTLDRADNDVSRFLSGLGAAVARLAMEPVAQGTPVDVVESLARHNAPFALFLDDFELIQEPAVLGLVREIIDHLPRRGQLVLGSRGLPDLGLGRLRARGQLVELDTEHLRFSLEETTHFFQLRSAQPLSTEALARLHGKTEGWVAALWLASMALDRRGSTDSDFIERISGSNRAIADYLAEDVLAHQGTEVREFLLRTSILRQLNVSVCQALNPRLDSARVLEQLDSANLFLTPITGVEGSGPLWRYHSLFADFLRNQLAREHPDELPRLHLAASAWYESQGQAVPAVEHAIEGGDFPHALSLLEPHADEFLFKGQLRLLARWFGVIPDEALATHPRLQAIRVWATCFTQGPWQAMDQLERIDTDRADAALSANVNALRPLLLAMMDRYEDAYRVGHESLATLPSASAFADSVLTNAMANVVSVMGHHHEAHRLLDAARATQGSSHFVRMYTESMEGLLDLQEGRLRQATARFRMAVTGGHGTTYNHTNGHAWAGIFYASVVYEADQLDQAEHLLNVYLPLARDVGLPDHMILSHVLRSRIAFLRGDIDAAFHALTELEYLGHHRQLPRVVASAKLERSRMLLLQGHAQASRDELSRANDQILWQRVARQRLPAHELHDLRLARLRWDICFGDAQQAMLPLQEELLDAQARTRHGRVHKLRVLQALAQQRTGDIRGATETLLAVLRQTCHDGFIRLILDEGPAVAVLLHRCQAHLQTEALNTASPVHEPTDPIFDEYLQRLLKIVGPVALAETDSSGTPAQPLAEPLTRKEIRVLQLLAEGYSNGAMAEKLFVSDSTVRTHLRNINLKLGTHSRTQAVAIARKLAVIR
ncbi:MAG TPA: LuxR C-terminal-related transcriptional regulator [Candidatus Aquabacterium excrementipullorum]|nr:LuxR C-terminal-related transcriptional regulator [Candidatus Aquabacterium excrementipullorum]